MPKRNTLLRAGLVAASLLLVVACTGSNSVKGSMGRLDVQMTDTPIDMTNVASVVVTISDVEVFGGAEGTTMDDGMPIVVSTHPATFDLLTLTGGATTLLASGEVPTGFYNRIRLDITSATLTYKDGTTADLKIDSNKVDVPIGFQVTASSGGSVVLDFNAAASVQVNDTSSGSLILRPVVTPKQA